MSEAEPVNAEVGHFGNFGKCCMNFSRVLITGVFRKEARAEKGRIADDGTSFGPWIEQGVGADDVLVEVVEREVAFKFKGMRVLAGELIAVIFPEFFGVTMGEAAGEH